MRKRKVKIQHSKNHQQLLGEMLDFSERFGLKTDLEGWPRLRWLFTGWGCGEGDENFWWWWRPVKELAAVMEIRSCDYFGERKERDVDRKINVILERERKEMLYF
jgi:hypothetical protein